MSHLTVVENFRLFDGESDEIRAAGAIRGLADRPTNHGEAAA